jgi:fatty acid desaturase
MNQSTNVITKKHIKIPLELYKINNLIFIKKLLMLIISITLSYFFILTQGWYFYVLGTLLAGALYAHAIELQHQCLHNTAFNNRKINRAVGFVLGLPMLVSFTHYQVNHMNHHRHIGTAEDKEFFSYYSISSQSKYKYLILNALNWKRYYVNIKTMILACISININTEIKPYKLRIIRNEYLAMFFIINLLLIITFVFRTDIFIKLWIIPVFLVSEPVHFFIELPEHFKCSNKNPNIFDNTRTIKGSKFSFWFTNGNNYHVEHHLLPTVPIHNLPSLHEKINLDINHLNQTYFDFYKNILDLKESSR